MPNIESLSFELILNDDQFNEKIKKVKADAEGLNTDISTILESINKIGRGGSSAPKKSVILESLRSEIKQTEAEIKSLEAKYTSLYRNAAKEDNGVFIASTKVDNKFRDLTNEAETLRKKLKELQEAYKKLGGDKALAASFKETKKAANDTNIELLQMREYYKNLEKSSKASADAQKRAGESAKSANTHLTKQSRLWRDISGLAMTYFSVQGATSLVRNLINITAEFEKQRVSLQAILRDADGANALFDRIKDLAVLSPFSFKELVTYTKQLSAYSIPMGELYDTTKMLADVSAGLGVGMDRLVLAYGQIRSAAFLRGCLGKGTLIRTERGIIPIEDVVVGDKLYNEYNEVVNVLELIRGHEQMYLVKQSNGADYRVNENHILTCAKDFHLHDIYAKDWDKSYSGVRVVGDDIIAYPIAIEKDTIDDYYGFVLDGNKRFQLGDGTVTHNTEVRQLTEAGVPILNELAKQIEELEGKAVSVGEVFDRISSRQISFQMVEKVFKDMTSEGGKFYNMQETLATTLSGKLSNLTDAYQIMFSEIGDKNKGMMVAAVDLARSLAENYEKVGRALTELIAAYGTYKAVLAITQLANGTFIASNTKLIASITNVKKALSTAVLSNPYAIVAAGVTALIYSLYKLGDAFFGVNEIQKAYDKSMAESQAHIEGEVSRLDKLYASLNLAKEGTDEYYAARKAIMGQYSEYIAKLKEEGKAVDDLKGIYVDLMAKVRQAAVERYNSVALKSAQDALDKVEDEISKSFAKRFDKGMIGGPKGLKNATETQKQAILQWIFGTMSTEDATEYVQRSWLGFFQWMKTDYQKAADTYTKISQDIVKANTDLNKNLGNTEQLTEFTKRVQETLASFGYTEKNKDSVAALWADQYTDQIEYIDQLRSRRSAILKQEAELASYETSKKKALEDELKIINAIFKATEYSPTAPSVIEETSKDTSKERISGIQSQIKAYQKLKDIYNELLDDFSDEQARNIMAAYLPTEGKRVYADFDVEIQKLITDLKALGNEGNKAANELMFSMGEKALKDSTAELKRKSEAVKQYKELLEEWTSIGSVEGKGVALDVSNIVNNYDKAVRDVAKKRDEALGKLDEQLEAKEIDEIQYNIAANAVINGSDVERANELTEATDKANEAIVKLYDEWRDGNIDFNNLSDKSINQLQEMQDKIDNFDVSNLDEKTIANLQSLGLTLEDVKKIIEGLKGEDIDKLGEQLDETKLKQIKSIANSILKLADALQEYADATDNVGLANIAEGAVLISDTVKNAIQGFSEGGAIGAVVGGVTTIAEYMLKSATEAAQLRSELEEIARQQYIDRINESIERTSTIFGESWMGKIRALDSGIKEFTDRINAAQEATYHQLRQYGNPNTEWTKSLKEILSGFAEVLNMDLFDENGVYNVNTLDAIWKKYGDVIKAYGLKEQFDEIRDAAENLSPKIKELNEAIGEMFDDLGSEIADQMIESLWATGEAATDLEDTFKSLGNTIFKSLLQSFVIDEILSKYKDEVTKMWTSGASEEDLADMISDFTKKVQEDVNDASDFATALFNYWNGMGLLSNEVAGTAENTLANGIKGITEDTANLLASYVNAIRADVSYNKMQLQQILGLLPSSPTLADYLTQIQANTYNTAEHTREMMTDIKSMMTTSDGPALRVFM